MQPRRVDEMEELEVDLMPPASVVRAIQAGEIPHLATATAVALAMLAGLE